ncbi:alpha/beta fold hydrolase [Salirhabdus euzebyi]|uniref:alpha/beta fold hydrolase n=1 Tax=Salirhabdus euzebyi TaxID=394506 RepID=UPI0028934A8C|nr:alpha/beta fold hydrolase [Salirhabdus euzebyi]
MERLDLQSIPTLHVVESSKKEQALPTVLYIHGFTSAKEHNLPFAYLLAEKGYRVLLPDSLYHGERTNGKNADSIQFEFWNIVGQNVKEVYSLYEEAKLRSWLEHDRFGLAGTSMGGISTCAALTQFNWIKVGAVLMGSPKPLEMATYLIEQIRQNGMNIPYSELEIKSQLEQLKRIDLSQNMDKLNERPLFFWHGDADPVVPFSQSYSFYEEVSMYYENKEKIKHVKEKGRGHKVSREAILETVDWFVKYL